MNLKRSSSYQPVAGIWIIIALLILGELWIAMDGKHYWHDIRFMYAATEFTLDEIFAGVFNPHQAWTAINEESASGFYGSKMLHIVLLKMLFTAVDPAAGGLALAVVLSTLLMACTLLVAYFMYFQIFHSRHTAVLGAVCALLAPVVPYLAGKFLSESSSLFLVLIALTLMTHANSSMKRDGALLPIIAGVFLAMAGLARLDSLLGPAGFFIASIVIPLRNSDRTIVFRNALLAAAAFIVVYFSVLKIAGINAASFIDYYLAFTNAGQKSVVMSLIGIVTIGGAVYILAFVGLFSERSNIVRFLVIWLFATVFPVLFITWHYMVEPRYLIQGLLPLCGLGALGLEKIRCGLNYTGKYLAESAVILLPLMLGVNYLLVHLMPYELDRPALLEAVASIHEQDPSASTLIPWSYTDFNFLWLVKPDARIFNVNSSVSPDLDKDLESKWKQRFKSWYGDQYISERHQLDERLNNGPVYYMGWRVYPPVQAIIDSATAIGWMRLVNILHDLQLKDHRKESWVWGMPELNMQYSGHSGQYEYYRVEYASAE